MIEVFVTDVQDQDRANRVLNLLEHRFPGLRFNIDFGDWESSPSPCEYKILRVKGLSIEPNDIISLVKDSGFKCDVLPDKICK